MHHKKREHTDYVQNCWNFISGLCEFNEDSCWFKHSPKNDKEKPEEYKCNICDHAFSARMNFMKHRKEFHESLTPQCKNELKGNCHYGIKCWFRHTDNKNENQYTDKNKKDERVIQRILKIMEEMSQRIVKIENEKNT